MTNPERNTAPAVKYRVGSLGELCLVADIRDDEHLYELRTLTGVEWYDAAGNWTEPPAVLPDGSGLASAKAAATPAPTGHIHLAWLALVLLLVAPFLAIADPPRAPDAGTPDAGSVLPLHLTPRRDPWLPMIDLPPQPHHPPAGDPPSPSTGDKPG